jgi:hypothetical protein
MTKGHKANLCGAKWRKLKKVYIFFAKDLDISKKSCNFAAIFEIAGLGRALRR